MSQTEIIQKFNDVTGKNVHLSAIQDPLNNTSSPLVTSYLEEYNRLSDLEKNVLTIAKTVLKKKKFATEISANCVETISPLIGQLYSRCIAKLHYARDVPKDEIFKTIQDLIINKWIVSGQRRTRKEIIENPIFKRILNFIERHPGTYSRDPAIEKEISMTRSPFLKHIRVLEAFNFVQKKNLEKQQIFS